MTAPVPDKPDETPAPKRAGRSRRHAATLMVSALGVVYGDIGTSPLYALRECFAEGHGLAVTRPNLFGVISLIFWALTVIISIKYILYIMRADNQGEGGVLALMAQSQPGLVKKPRAFAVVLLLGMIGAALLYGDGIITPAISVLSAVEGLEVMRGGASEITVPLAVCILVAVFAVQRFGTARVGVVFGPIMMVWFATLAVLGIAQIVRRPEILGALSPVHAVAFFQSRGFAGVMILGSVFLVVTGGEALYADMGHFGRRIISRAWFVLVGPALMLNYLGQGALLLEHPEAAQHPFFALAPPWALGPLVLLSTCAAVIASQALITGAFSLTSQAVMLGILPRLKILHTSDREFGQIYVPAVNWLLLVATVLLVILFGSSSRLAAAYGVAVAATMVISTVVAAFAFRSHFGWSIWLVVVVSLPLLVVDTAFLVACSARIAQGGWVPLGVAAVVVTLMATWRRGRELMGERIRARVIPLEDFFEIMRIERPARVPGAAVFLTGTASGAPLTLLRNLEHNRVVHQSVLLLTVVTEKIPVVPEERRLELSQLPQGFSRAVVRYGFMETPNLARLFPIGDGPSIEHTTFFFGRESVVPVLGGPLARLGKRLFGVLAHNEARAPGFFQLPSDRIVEMGSRLEL